MHGFSIQRLSHASPKKSIDSAEGAAAQLFETRFSVDLPQTSTITKGFCSMNTAIAEIELLNLDLQVENFDRTDAFTWLLKTGVPLTVVTRLEELWTTTKELGGKIIKIGKIIIFKIIDFIKRNAKMALGIVLGAAVGALINMVPLIGPLLSPLSIAIMAFFGGTVGTSLDHPEANTPYQAAFVMACEFLSLLAEILKTLWNEFTG
jgi:hypothetical protein